MDHPIRLHTAFASLAALSALACGACPDGSEPNDACQCPDGTQLEPDQCSTDEGSTGPAAPEDPERPVAHSWNVDGSRGDWLAVEMNDADSPGKVLRPPDMNAGDEKSFSFDCGGEAHTQLAFALYGHAPEASGFLEIRVDGNLWARRYPAHWANGWAQLKLDVARGTHEYTFTVKTPDGDSPGPFSVDTFRCIDVTPQDAVNGVVDLDDGFVPTEIEGDWVVDNLNGVHEGECAVHPPPLLSGDKSSMALTCPGTQLSFRLQGGGPDSVATLEFEIDDEPRAIIGQRHWANGYAEFVFNVPSGDHVYRFDAHASNDSGPPFVLDTFECTGVEPFPAVNGRIDFDDGFVPVEVSGGWVVDNAGGVHEGKAAARPPALSAGEEKSMIIDCSEHEHSQLSFRLGSAGPDAQGELDLFADGELIETYGTFHWANGFMERTVPDLGPGPHVYEFVARAINDGFSPFIVDTVICDDLP